MATTSAPAALALTHLNLDVRDLDVSERFYRDGLGLPVERRETSLRVCTAEYLLVLNVGEPAVGGTFHFGFRVPTRDDVDAWAAHLRVANVRLLVEPHETGPVYVARIADPDAYEIEIYAELK
ncbi:MAG: VOC family protein [Candidatus Eremiobacteraeota bacterium]|nr:VOC family protein [Candidatus Eremiobacteraeota bacterium]